MNNNRWGLPEGYNSAPSGVKVEAPQTTERVIVDKTAVQAANKTVNVLETVLNDVKIENERLKRDITVLSTQNNTLNDRLNQANTKVAQLEASLSTHNYNSYKAETVAYTPPPITAKAYTPNLNQIIASDKTYPHIVPSINQSLAAAYSAPINPMTVFVEFLEELTILEDYIKIAEEDGIGFELLCNQYNPSDYIDAVCVDDDGDFLEGWEEANELWITICDTDSLDDKEAYIE
jgi:hypothetical protein